VIKKYLIWASFAIIIGVFLSFFIFRITAFSANFVGDFFSRNISYLLIDKEDVQEKEEVKFDDVFVPEGDSFKEIEQIEDTNLVPSVISGVGKMWGAVSGLTMFRGNPTRTLYGLGPIPDVPKTLWKYPKEVMCSPSTSLGETKIWCGSGWTGQPVVWEKEDGKKEIIFGAYDKNVHFIDGDSGKDVRSPFETGDIIKGSVTLDPDGFPLLYFGSRDNKLRIVALDRNIPTEIWALDSEDLKGIWNNDWDGNPVVINDVLYEGGENGWFYAIKLNRKFDENNKVKISPKIIFSMPSYTKELISLVGRNVSIENSLAFFGNRVYFSNSGGRVIGLDISKIEEGVAPMVFDYWVGDDVDSTIVIDEEGMLYVSVELERFNDRSKELGQFIKLNPKLPNNPYVWGVQIPNGDMSVGGIWATPALYKNYIYVPTHTGRFLGVNRKTGKIVWEEKISPHAWSSPVVVDDKLLIGTCDGNLKKYSLSNPESPVLDWSYRLGGGSCIESTPAIWKGQIFIGSRDGYFYSVGEKL
jgi:outer membrane protein assembly factor BamB